jgi:hypothetical protein
MAAAERSISDAVPAMTYVNNAADIVEGVTSGVLKAIDFIRLRWAKSEVELLSGYPQDICRVLQLKMLASIGEKALDVSIAAVKIGIAGAGDSLAPMVGSLFSLIVGLIQRVVAIIDAVIQALLLRSVVQSAEKQSGAGIRTHADFTHWFRGELLRAPIIGALVLTSAGEVAHPHKFLKFIDPNDSGLDDITVDEMVDAYKVKFQKGVTFIARLKDEARKYIQSYKAQYGVEFGSKEGHFDGLLNNVQTNRTLTTIWT